MMSAAAPKITPAAPTVTAQHIAEFLRDFSIEATRPTAADLDELKSAASGIGRIYLSAVPTRPLSDLLAFSAAVRIAGFEPVPHLAVRNFETPIVAEFPVGECIIVRPGSCAHCFSRDSI